jgi:hypothetical protein
MERRSDRSYWILECWKGTPCIS